MKLSHSPSLLFAFTLVELIVVVTILWILATIGFVSYSGYITGARDSNRYAQITKLSDALQTYATSKSLPLPDEKIDIRAQGKTIAHQGYAGVNVLETINYTNGGIDPKDNRHFSYYLSKDRKKMQLLTFMEEKPKTTAIHSLPFSQSYANTYEYRYPKTYGNKLGILISAENTTLNIPAQEIPANKGAGQLDISNATETYNALIDTSTNTTYTGSGYTLWWLLATRYGKKAPTNCPKGFIWVPWNAKFHLEGFCVAQYEMTYADANTPNSIGGGTDWNTVAYVPNKTIVSQAGKYPIADINQEEAIASCKSMWKGYHLMTNNEWMTIARNIEANPTNWSEKQVGKGYVYNGVSHDSEKWCDIDLSSATTRRWAAPTWRGTDTNCNTRRSHKLISGGTIWDISGNLWEHVNKANNLDGANFNTWRTSIAGSSNNTNWDNDGVYANNDMQKYGAATWRGKWAGMWNLHYAWWGNANNIFLRGGAANYDANAGLFALDLIHAASFESHATGFRCAK